MDDSALKWTSNLCSCSYHNYKLEDARHSLGEESSFELALITKNKNMTSNIKNNVDECGIKGYIRPKCPK